MSRLRLDWYSPLSRLANEPTRHPWARVNRVLATAEQFVFRWGDWAEFAGMRPAHLLTNREGDQNARGLAWRYEFCGEIDVVCFPRKGYIVTMGRELYFVYHFVADGSVRSVYGVERSEIMGSQFELDFQPTVRRKALLSSLDITSP